MRLLAGLLLPTSGSVEVLGRRPARAPGNPARRFPPVLGRAPGSDGESRTASNRRAVSGSAPLPDAPGEAVRDVGYMPQRFGLYEDLSVIDNLNLHAELRGLEGPARRAMFEKLLAFTALTPFTDRLAGKLSGGMKQKLGLACALLTTPRLLLLDDAGWASIRFPGASCGKWCPSSPWAACRCFGLRPIWMRPSAAPMC